MPKASRVAMLGAVAGACAACAAILGIEDPTDCAAPAPVDAGPDASPPSDGASDSSRDCDACRTVFVTAAYPGSLGGLDGGDAHCQQAAAVAQLSGTYKAWLSTDAPNSAIRNRFTFDARELRRTDGMVIKSSLEALLDSGFPEVPIDRLADKSRFACGGPVGVWTGTTNHGEPMTEDCTSWMDAASTGTRGSCSGFTMTWSYNGTVGNVCTTESALYCFEQ